MKTRYLILSLFWLPLTIMSAQIPFFGFERSPVFIQQTAVVDTFFGYGSDWKIKDGKRAFSRKIVLWDSNGEILKSMDISFLNEFNYEGNTYIGLTSGCYLSPDKRKIIIRGRNYQFQGDEIKTVIYAYDIENDLWETLFYSKDYALGHIKFHPSDTTRFVAENLNDLSNSKIQLFEFENLNMSQQIKAYPMPGLPICVQFSEDGRHLFVFESLSNGSGYMDVFKTVNFTLLKRIAIKDHIETVFENEKYFLFSGSFGAYIYSKNDFKFIKSISSDIQGIISPLNLAILGPAGADTEGALKIYNLSTHQIEKIPFDEPIYSHIYNYEKELLMGLLVKTDFIQESEDETIPTGFIYELNLKH